MTILRPRSRRASAAVWLHARRIGRWRLWRRAWKWSAAWRMHCREASACSRRERRRRSERSTAYFDGARCEAPLFERSELVAGDRIVGPGDRHRGYFDDRDRSGLAGGSAARRRVVADRSTAIADADRGLSQSAIRNPKSAISPIRCCSRSSTICLASIAEQMGVTLRNTASSVNVKERLDFSCAIFTADGAAGGQCAARARASGGDGGDGAAHDRGESRLAAGRRDRDERSVRRRLALAGRHGRHAGARSQRRGELLFFTASRAHHAEIGGIAPARCRRSRRIWPKKAC